MWSFDNIDGRVHGLSLGYLCKALNSVFCVGDELEILVYCRS